jgi:hypothetical protein
MSVDISGMENEPNQDYPPGWNGRKKNGVPLALPNDTEFTVHEGNVAMIMESFEDIGGGDDSMARPVVNLRHE